MALVTFAKVADLQRLAPALSTEDAQLALEMASSSIRASVQWDVDRAADKVYTRVIPFARRGTTGISSVILPAINVTAVSEVKVDDVVVPSTGYEWTTSGIVFLESPATRKVEVTYTAGWARTPVDAAPPVFRTIALEVAARVAGNPEGVREYTMGQTSESFASELKDALDEDPRLDPYRVSQP